MTLNLFFAWLALTNVFAFFLFAWDKSRASRPGQTRVSEFNLCLAGAIGGWPGGLIAMILLRHKTAKLSFHLKYALALITWAGLLYLGTRGVRS